MACASAPEEGAAPEPATPAARAEARTGKTETPSAQDPRFAAAAAYSASQGGRVFLVVQGDEIVFEAASDGASSSSPHPIRGGSEAFWGVAALLADQEDLIDLDEPVSFTLEEWKDETRRSDVRIRQLLHFTSGLEGGFDVLEDAPDRFSAALRLEMISRAGERFQYGPSHLTVFGELLRRKLAEAGRDEDPTHYLEEVLLGPIGIAGIRWDRDAAGNPDVASGAHLTARQWARFGQLLRDGGVWGGRRLLDADSAAALREGSRSNPGFGLAIWTNPQVETDEARPPWMAVRPSFYPGGLPDMLVAAGLGGQRLYAIPSLDLVVVRFATSSHGFRDAVLLGHVVDGVSAPAAGEAATPQP
jgi:CubicO group peptidase (beta-lactamase class C family)